MRLSATDVKMENFMVNSFQDQSAGNLRSIIITLADYGANQLLLSFHSMCQTKLSLRSPKYSFANRHYAVTKPSNRQINIALLQKS